MGLTQRDYPRFLLFTWPIWAGKWHGKDSYLFITMEKAYICSPNPPFLLQRFIKGLEGNIKTGFLAVLSNAAGGSELL